MILRLLGWMVCTLIAGVIIAHLIGFLVIYLLLNAYLGCQ